jgi:fatty acid synthase subunit beta
LIKSQYQSTYLSDLSKKINAAQLNLDMLVEKYIPKLVAKTFKVSREYARLIYDQTSSPRLDQVLKKWDQDNRASAGQRQRLAYIIQVELLAYQFASPVRWIETQDHLFKNFAFQRFFEIGPSSTFTCVVTRTLKAKYEDQDDSITHPRAILCHAKSAKEIYYQFKDELVASEAAPMVSVASPALSQYRVSMPYTVSTCFATRYQSITTQPPLTVTNDIARR